LKIQRHKGQRVGKKNDVAENSTAQHLLIKQDCQQQPTTHRTHQKQHGKNQGVAQVGLKARHRKHFGIALQDGFAQRQVHLDRAPIAERDIDRRGNESVDKDQDCDKRWRD
jgi:hypothetical protein